MAKSIHLIKELLTKGIIDNWLLIITLVYAMNSSNSRT